MIRVQYRFNYDNIYEFMHLLKKANDKSAKKVQKDVHGLPLVFDEAQ